MTGNREKPVRIDRRLAMFGCDDNKRRLKQVLLSQFAHHLADGAIDKFDFTLHCGSRSSGSVSVTALDAFLDQLLSYAHRLEVHAKDCRHRSLAQAVVGLTANLI